MGKRPSGDLGGMAVSKTAAADAVPFSAAPAPRAVSLAPASGASGTPKSLTIKLDGAAYARLRAYCFHREQATGSRVTHQDVMVRALAELLAREQEP